MSALPWIKVYADLPGHPKSLALARRLNDPRAWSYVVAMWLHAARFAGDGRFTDAEAVELAAGWTGEPGELVAALVAVRFLETRGRAYVVHDWNEYQAAHMERREKDRAAKRAKRAEEREKRRRDVGRTSAPRRQSVGSPSAPPSLSPSPSPSPSASEGRTDPDQGNLPAPSVEDFAADLEREYRAKEAACPR